MYFIYQLRSEAEFSFSVQPLHRPNSAAQLSIIINTRVMQLLMKKGYDG